MVINEAGELQGSTSRGRPSNHPRRIPSERSDIAMLTAALAQLCDDLADTLGPPGQVASYPLRKAIWSARESVYRATRNRDDRAKREARKAAKAARR